MSLKAVETAGTGDGHTAPLVIVVGLDFTEGGGAAFAQAARIAMRVPGSALHLLHVFESEPSEERSRAMTEHLRLYVNEKGTAMGGLGGLTVGIHLRAGEPVRELARLATEVGADLIAVGARERPHMKSRIVGS